MSKLIIFAVVGDGLDVSVNSFNVTILNFNSMLLLKNRVKRGVFSLEIVIGIVPQTCGAVGVLTNIKNCASVDRSKSWPKICLNAILLIKHAFGDLYFFSVKNRMNCPKPVGLQKR